MSTLNVVEEVLRERRAPMVVKEIVEVAGLRLPTRSRTPDTVVARDLAMDIKKKGEESKFARIAPGKYTLREYAAELLAHGSTPVPEAAAATPMTDVVAEPVASPPAPAPNLAVASLLGPATTATETFTQ